MSTGEGNLLNIKYDTLGDKQPKYANFLYVCGKLLGILSIATGGCIGNPYKTVNKGNKCVIERFGKLLKIGDEGMHYVNPLTDKIMTYDMRTFMLDMSKQSIITKDNLSLHLDGMIVYHIYDIFKYKYTISNPTTTLNQTAISTLRTIFGHKTLQECLEQRDELKSELKISLMTEAINWGIQIESVQIQDIIIPDNIQKLLASAAIAKREGEAKIIASRADVESAKLMREAADMLNTDAAMQIRLLETYSKLAQSNNAKIIFMPSDSSNLGKNIAAINTL